MNMTLIEFKKTPTLKPPVKYASKSSSLKISSEVEIEAMMQLVYAFYDVWRLAIRAVLIPVLNF